ncbi:MAG: hypothetical protein LKG27_05285 [Clostridiaceae bacterium]|nr:hypothetical protein [Clostridiaceae bacterium]
MNKKQALTPVGIAIAIVVLLGMVMILSAPMLVDTTKKPTTTTEQPDTKATPNPNDTIKNDVDKNTPSPEVTSMFNQLQSQINFLTTRVSNLESAPTRSSSSASQGGKNQYSCTLEGVVDQNGNTIPMSQMKTRTPDTKFVFVCGNK